ncbi:GNAT family N-acetyltransferase [Pseudooceanicola sp. CBS1P-1]|uniref:GNAT family N-acetyltransferase n=1 Tax=Pseudooceanicola albus TaxID=2692189 RepID=A0A6L7G4Y7_9RHOB|nr:MULTISPECIES: GNAT family N-acetyltransferase [Pseudooceanicola]MBT9384739.1 GNAT family N-acetyltransferase [Pseudooceanicola endophyticus]MXN18440.1 GNAT family N-acetyltransferase [Pseudooceanicola albus]
MVQIALADPESARPLLEASHALMQSLYNPEENHFLGFDALRQPDIRFFTATEAGRLLGCGALQIKEGYGEVKSFFTAPEARGRGIGTALLATIEATARAQSLPLLRLETGDALAAACRLYERAGFTRRPAFGAYPENGVSVFMEKPLAP